MMVYSGTELFPTCAALRKSEAERQQFEELDVELVAVLSTYVH